MPRTPVGLQIGHDGNTFVLHRYMGDETLDQPKFGGFPPQGGAPVGRDANMAQYRGVSVITIVVSGNFGGGPGGGGYVRPPPL